MALRIPAEELDFFAEYITSPDYLREERYYKIALHEVLRRLLSDEVRHRDDFGRLLKDLFSGESVYERLGFSEGEQQTVRQMLDTSGIAGPNMAIANLSGGRWGAAQFIWIPRAIDHDMSEELRAAFDALLDERSLGERVNDFRALMYEAQKTLRDRGGFAPKWNPLPVALSFVASLLGAYDPTSYSFYAATPLRRAFEMYGSEWPRGTAGERYERICDFVRGVFGILSERGIPVEDLIDAQSFLWLVRDRGTRPLEHHPATLAPPPETPDLELIAAELARQVHWPIEEARRLVLLATANRQLLFFGPPGTGKTFVAQVLARLLSGEEEGRAEVVQFHPAYSYEDFVEGIRPKLAENEALGFEVRPGILLRLAQRARDYPDERFFLIVDEINRANLPRVFGELLYALEYRGADRPYQLPYSGDETYLPENLWIIGTMNTADRSIALVDAAVRRRFKHVRFEPDTSVLRRWLSAQGRESIGNLAASRLDSLNTVLLPLLDGDRLIGHSFLMRSDLNEGLFATIWQEDLEPVLREHLYNRPDHLAALRVAFVGT